MASYNRIALTETDSTNRYLTDLCNEQGEAEVKEFTTITAEHQTAGKGQRGNSWEAEEGKNLLFSTVLYPTFMKVRKQFVLSQLISLAIKETLDEYTNDISIKWPNDIYWKEKKICGILIENELCGSSISRCICGIGLNINQEQFVSNAPNPVSLKQVTGKEENRDEILESIMQRINKDYTLLYSSQEHEKDIAKRYTLSLFRREGFHAYEDANGRFQARLLRVEADGRFVLEDEAGNERSYLFKEVQYLL